MGFSWESRKSELGPPEAAGACGPPIASPAARGAAPACAASCAAANLYQHTNTLFLTYNYIFSILVVARDVAT